MAEAKKTSAKKAKTAVVADPVTPEKDITEAAIESAKEQQTIIDEKRETVKDSKMAADSEAILDETLTEQEDSAKTAKAGKRSAKSLKEQAQKQAKEERKASDEDGEKPKVPVRPARTRVERKGKLYRQDSQKVDKNKLYSLEEAIKLAKDTSHVKFDATVELHVNLGVDPRHADQNIRDNLVLPAGTGKDVKVAVLTDDTAAATKAGADLAGTDEIFKQLDKGSINFDVLIALPTQMAKLGKYARLLGPRGLMPNPKSGTVTNDINRAVAEAKAGRVEYRVDSTGIVHLGVGKVSFSQTDLQNNAQAVLTSLKNNKPATVKGNYFKSIHLSTSMGPSVKVELSAAV
ncbi:MAG TPA: 50S ribosomal protein L1 [Candidatus Saccharimonadales bacterium]|nr:50S ribosomal protein L1 [Candidatus Saccharimonadales bacterium]